MAYKNKVKLPFTSLQELSLQYCASEHIYSLGFMALPQLRLLGIEALGDFGDIQRHDCKILVPYLNDIRIPVNLPSLTHVVLHNICENVIAPFQILKTALAVTHLVIRSPIPYVLWGLDWLSPSSVEYYCHQLEEFSLYVESCNYHHVEAIVNRRSQPLQKLLIAREMMGNIAPSGFQSRAEVAKMMESMVRDGRICVVEEDLIPRYEVEMERMRQYMQ